MRITAILSLVVAALAIDAGASAQAPLKPSGRVAILLGEGRLVVADAATGETVANIVASDAPRYRLQYGRLARLAGADELFMVLPDERVPVLMALNVRTLAARKVTRLPADAYTALAVGAKSGRVFAFGSLDMEVEIVDPRTGNVEARPLRGGTQQMFSAAVSAEEDRVYVSLHGNASGVDGYDITGPKTKHVLYLPTHGNFAIVGDRILAATGGPQLQEYDLAGNLLRQVDTRLVGNHLMEFALDAKRAIYAAGSCMYSGGLSRVNPGTNAMLGPVVRPAEPDGRLPPAALPVCGERISVAASGAWVALAALRDGVDPLANQTSSVLIVDTQTGAVLRTIPTTSGVVDVLVLN